MAAMLLMAGRLGSGENSPVIVRWPTMLRIMGWDYVHATDADASSASRISRQSPRSSAESRRNAIQNSICKKRHVIIHRSQAI